MGNLTREDFDSIDDLERVRAVPIPELDGVGFVLMLRADQRDAFDRSLFDDNGNRTQKNLGARLVCITLCDEHGKLLYSNEMTDVAALMGAWPTAVIERLFVAARNFNLMEKSAVEDAAKNSETTADGSSNSD